MTNTRPFQMTPYYVSSGYEVFEVEILKPLIIHLHKYKEVVFNVNNS